MKRKRSVRQGKKHRASSLPQLWKPGQSGNPAGRPKGVKYLSEHLREISKQVCDNPEHDHGELTNDECIARGLMMASRGDFSKSGKPDLLAATIYAERTEGKVKDVMELKTESKYPALSDEQVAAMLLTKKKNEEAGGQ